MSQYSTYDIDGFPFIPNTDSYMSEECREIGFAAEREAYADLEFINDFTDSKSELNVHDIYMYLYEKEHASCLNSCAVALPITHHDQ